MPRTWSLLPAVMSVMSRSMAANQRSPEFQTFEPHARRRLEGVSESQAKPARVASHFFLSPYYRKLTLQGNLSERGGKISKGN